MRFLEDEAEKNPTDIPNDIGPEDLPGGEDGSDEDSVEEEFDWAVEMGRRRNSDEESDYEMESDPDYEEDEWDHPDEEEEEDIAEEFNEGMALFEEWKSEFLAARKSSREQKEASKDDSADGSSAPPQP